MSRRPFLRHDSQGRCAEPRPQRSGQYDAFVHGQARHILRSNYKPVVINEGESILYSVLIPDNTTVWADSTDHDVKFPRGTFQWEQTMFVEMRPADASLDYAIATHGAVPYTLSVNETGTIDLLDAAGLVLKSLSISANYSRDVTMTDTTNTVSVGAYTPDADPAISAFNAIRYTNTFFRVLYPNAAAALYFITDLYDSIIAGTP